MTGIQHCVSMENIGSPRLSVRLLRVYASNQWGLIALGLMLSLLASGVTLLQPWPRLGSNNPFIAIRNWRQPIGSWFMTFWASCFCILSILAARTGALSAMLGMASIALGLTMWIYRDCSIAFKVVLDALRRVEEDDG
jgi:hypothetical protein